MAPKLRVIWHPSNGKPREELLNPLNKNGTAKSLRQFHQTIRSTFRLSTKQVINLTDSTLAKIIELESFCDDDTQTKIVLAWPLGEKRTISRFQEEIRYEPHYATITEGQEYPEEESKGHNSLAYAIAEFVDNSLHACKINDWTPKKPIVRVNFYRTRVGNKYQYCMAIRDNGAGMDKDVIRSFARFGLAPKHRAPVHAPSKGEGSRFVNGFISKYGVGAKQAGFYIGDSIWIISRPRSSNGEIVKEFNISVAEFEEREQSGEGLYQSSINSRRPGCWEDSSLKQAGEGSFPHLRQIVQEELKHPSFSLVLVTGIAPRHHKKLLQGHEHGGVCEELSHVYHYYLHGPDGRGKGNPHMKKKRRKHDIQSNCQIIVTMYDKKNILWSRDLANIDTDIESRYLALAQSEHKFSLKIPSKNARVQGIFLYFPIEGDQETLPRVEKIDPDVYDVDDDEDQLKKADLDPEERILKRHPVYEFYWHGRLIPLTTVDDLAIFKIPATKKECRNRLKCIMFTDDSFEVSRNKLRFKEELGLKKILENATIEVSKTRSRTVKFENWLMDCYKNLDKTILFENHIGTGKFKTIRYGSKHVFKKGDLVKFHFKHDIVFGTILFFTKEGSANDDMGNTGRVHYIREPREVYDNDQFSRPLWRLDRSLSQDEVMRQYTAEKIELFSARPNQLSIRSSGSDDFKSGMTRPSGHKFSGTIVTVLGYPDQHGKQHSVTGETVRMKVLRFQQSKKGVHMKQISETLCNKSDASKGYRDKDGNIWLIYSEKGRPYNWENCHDRKTGDFEFKPFRINQFGHYLLVYSVEDKQFVKPIIHEINVTVGKPHKLDYRPVGGRPRLQLGVPHKAPFMITISDVNKNDLTVDNYPDWLPEYEFKVKKPQLLEVQSFKVNDDYSVQSLCLTPTDPRKLKFPSSITMLDVELEFTLLNAIKNPRCSFSVKLSPGAPVSLKMSENLPKMLVNHEELGEVSVQLVDAWGNDTRSETTILQLTTTHPDRSEPVTSKVRPDKNGVATFDPRLIELGDKYFVNKSSYAMKFKLDALDSDSANIVKDIQPIKQSIEVTASRLPKRVIISDEEEPDLKECSDLSITAEVGTSLQLHVILVDEANKVIPQSDWNTEGVAGKLKIAGLGGKKTFKLSDFDENCEVTGVFVPKKVHSGRSLQCAATLTLTGQQAFPAFDFEVIPVFGPPKKLDVVFDPETVQVLEKFRDHLQVYLCDQYDNRLPNPGAMKFKFKPQINVVPSCEGLQPGDLKSGVKFLAAKNDGYLYFPDLAASGEPGNYTITIKSTSLAPASADFTLLPGPPHHFECFYGRDGAYSKEVLTTMRTRCDVGVISVRLCDVQGNVLSNFNMKIKITAPKGVQLKGTTEVAFMNGVAVFKNLSVSMNLNSAGTDGRVKFVIQPSSKNVAIKKDQYCALLATVQPLPRLTSINLTPVTSDGGRRPKFYSGQQFPVMQADLELEDGSLIPKKNIGSIFDFEMVVEGPHAKVIQTPYDINYYVDHSQENVVLFRPTTPKNKNSRKRKASKDDGEMTVYFTSSGQYRFRLSVTDKREDIRKFLSPKEKAMSAQIAFNVETGDPYQLVAQGWPAKLTSGSCRINDGSESSRVIVKNLKIGVADLHGNVIYITNNSSILKQMEVSLSVHESQLEIRDESIAPEALEISKTTVNRQNQINYSYLKVCHSSSSATLEGGMYTVTFSAGELLQPVSFDFTLSKDATLLPEFQKVEEKITGVRQVLDRQRKEIHELYSTAKSLADELRSCSVRLEQGYRRPPQGTASDIRGRELGKAEQEIAHLEQETIAQTKPPKMSVRSDGYENLEGYIGFPHTLATVENEEDCQLLSWFSRDKLKVHVCDSARSIAAQTLRNHRKTLMCVSMLRKGESLNDRVLLPHERKAPSSYKPPGHPKYAFTLLHSTEKCNKEQFVKIFRSFVGRTLVMDDKDSAISYREYLVGSLDVNCPSILCKKEMNLIRADAIEYTNLSAPPIERLPNCYGITPQRIQKALQTQKSLKTGLLRYVEDLEKKEAVETRVKAHTEILKRHAHKEEGLLNNEKILKGIAKQLQTLSSVQDSRSSKDKLQELDETLDQNFSALLSADHEPHDTEVSDNLDQNLHMDDDSPGTPSRGQKRAADGAPELNLDRISPPPIHNGAQSKRRDEVRQRGYEAKSSSSSSEMSGSHSSSSSFPSSSSSYGQSSTYEAAGGEGKLRSESPSFESNKSQRVTRNAYASQTRSKRSSNRQPARSRKKQGS